MNKQIFRDQMGRLVEIPSRPRRIISLVPSQTELLYDLGLTDEVVGVTKFCIHPKDRFGSVMKVGGTKQLQLDKIRDLKPDLIIGNKEENEQNQIEELMQEFPVWLSDIHNLPEAFKMIGSLGEITGRDEQALALIEKIESGFQKLRSAIPQKGKIRRVAYFIWKAPYMVAGANTFINTILNEAGWENAFQEKRYPEVSPESIRAAAPDLIFLSSEPYPFKEKHVAEFQRICGDAQVVVVDGELFSWYGSRLQYTAEYLISLQAVVNQ